MNLVTSRTLHSHLREEEALVVENAIRLAIESIINVLYGVNSARMNEYQRRVDDRDKEIQRLECRLRELERELQVPHQQMCTCGILQKATDSNNFYVAQTSTDPQALDQGQEDPSCADVEVTMQECEKTVPFALFARPSSHISSQSHESSLPLSPSRMGLELSGTPRSSESSSASEVTVNVPTSPSSCVVKEEPCDMSAVFIGWEMSEEGSVHHQEGADMPSQDNRIPSEKQILEDDEQRHVRVKPHTVPDGHPITEREHLRIKKKSVPTSELSEEAQRLKRAAWRAASRRYYARKIARQQANSAHGATFPQDTDSQYSQTMDQRTLTSELPNECQVLQRAAWRAASKRYYARKIARHQTEPTPYVHLLQNTEWSE